MYRPHSNGLTLSFAVEVFIRLPEGTLTINTENNHSDKEFHFFFLAFLAVDKAIAIACFWGFPDFISLRMFSEIVFLE
jgi:hypothetical protein